MLQTRREQPLAEAWLDFPAEAHIAATVGSASLQRGAAYAQQGRVSWITTDAKNRVLYASVHGSARQPYQTLVRVGGAAERYRSSGRCTCPMAVDCKHVAAVLLAALEGGAGVAARARPATPAVPQWEQVLADVVPDPETRDPQGIPLGLQVEVVRGAARGDAQSVRVRIRPVVPGKRSTWVRTGVSWRDLAYSWGADRRVAGHREALRELYQAQHATTGGYGDAAVYLDEFGPALWPLLRRVVDAGVSLVPAKGTSGPVHLAEEPGELSLDLTATPAGDVTAAAVVDIPGAVGDASSVTLVGRPAHGVVLDYVSRQGSDQPGMLLAPLHRPLTQQASALLRAGELHVPSADVERFLHQYYPGLRQVIPVQSSDGSVQLPEIAPPRLGLRLTYAADHRLDLEWSFLYETDGEPRHVPLHRNGGAARDRLAEKRLLRELSLPGAQLPRLRREAGDPASLAEVVELRGAEAAVFTDAVLPSLRAQGVVVEVVGTPADYQLSEAAPVIRVSTTDSDDADWFDLGVTVELDGEHIPFELLFVALAREESHLVLDSGTYFSIERPELDQLRRLIAEAQALEDREPDQLRISTYQVGLWEELSALGVVEAQSERWGRTVESLLAGEGAAPPAAPDGLAATLRPYQLDGYRWLSFLMDAGLGGILADDMGLGKTVQTLASICRAKENGGLRAPLLVVAPTSVVGNWAQEAARFAPGIAVTTITRTQAKAGRPLADAVSGADVAITSYALFRIDEEAYQDLPWSGLVLDEAQFVKNHQAKTYQCARKLAAPFKLAITGTPLENSLMDLWSLLSLVAPGMFPDPKKFTETYRKPIERGTDPELLTTLRRRIRPFIRRRTKEQVAADLPAKQEQVLTVELNSRHHKIYQTHLQRERRKVLRLVDDLDKNRFTILRSLTLLRQLSLDPALVDGTYAGVRSSKVDALLEQLEEVVAGGHRALVFSQFTGFLHTVRDRLDAEGVDYCYLDGRTRNRVRRIEEFKTGRAPVFLISLKAGGFGLNLTEADYCFILDPWWNPATEAQAVDRTHRIGQDKNVMVYRLVADDTIEEKVVELQKRKRDLFDRVIDDGGELSSALTADDIRELLVP